MPSALVFRLGKQTIKYYYRTHGFFSCEFTMTMQNVQNTKSRGQDLELFLPSFFCLPASEEINI